MTARERFHATLSYQKPSLYHHEIGLFWSWEETQKRWRNEGWDGAAWENLFAIDQLTRVPVNYGPSPEFEEITLEENDQMRVYQSQEGVIIREPKLNRSSYMPEFLRYPVSTREEYRKFRKERLDTPFAGRIMEGEGAGFVKLSQAEKEKRWKKWRYWSRTSTHPIFCFTARWGGFFGPLRSLMGVEKACLAFYDEPELVAEFMEERADAMIRITDAVLDQTDFDFFGFWEDMAGKNGSLVSPQQFREFTLPHYRRVCEHLYKHGVKYIFIDSDGDINKLIPLWLEAGINGVFPCEVAAGVDVVALRKKFGKNLLLFGGVDKRAVARGKNDIIAEVERIAPVVEEGGYLPCFDHSAHADISWNNMCFYMEYMQKRFKTLAT